MSCVLSISKCRLQTRCRRSRRRWLAACARCRRSDGLGEVGDSLRTEPCDTCVRETPARKCLELASVDQTVFSFKRSSSLIRERMTNGSRGTTHHSAHTDTHTGNQHAWTSVCTNNRSTQSAAQPGATRPRRCDTRSHGPHSQLSRPTNPARGLL